MANRVISRLRIGACLLGLFSFVFATAQTPPPTADDDSFPFAILIKALTPVCSAFTATPASVLSGGNVALAATCSNSPTTYEWYRGSTLLGTTTTATFSSAAPATVATYEYAVIAKRGNISSLRKAANVSVIALPPLSVSTVTNTTVNTPVSIQGTFNAPANSANVRVSVGNNLVANLTNVAGNFSASWTPTQSGVYQIRVEAVNNSTLQVLATNLTKVVVADVPAATAMTIPGNSSAGATAGGFGVSDMGGAQYSIPISIPPGIAGMQPSVSLGYSNTGGNGHVGVGWAIGGLSAISRCPKTIAQDGARSGINYDLDVENDAFCIDGQRLIPVGTPSLITGKDATGQSIGEVKVREYRTEIDRFDRILSYEATANSLPNYKNILAGPSNFKVFTKSGQIMEYGLRWLSLNSGNSQVGLDPSRGNTAQIWPLDKVSDRNGNYYVVDYAGNVNAITSGPAIVTNTPLVPVGSFPAVEFYPVQITYTFNKGKGITSVNRVLFEYGDRPTYDRHVMFDSGAGQHILTKRLERISTYIDGALIDYDNVPLPNPITNTNLYPICTGFQCGTKVKEFRLAYDATPITNRSRLVSLQECAADGICLAPTTFAWSNSGASFQGTSPSIARVGGADINAFAEFRVADMNGDGRSDLVRRYGSFGATAIQMLLTKPDGTFTDVRLTSRTTTPVPNPPDAGEPISEQLLDVNGDGRVDYLHYRPRFGTITICATNADVNGVVVDVSCNPYTLNPKEDIFLIGDFNGDGKMDLMIYRGTQFVNQNLAHQWQVYYGTANGLDTINTSIFSAPYTASSNAGNSYLYTAANFVVGDFNGDGRADVIARKDVDCAWQGAIISGTPNPCTADSFTWRVFFSTLGPNNTALFDTTSVKEVLGTNSRQLSYVNSSQLSSASFDFNGDGIADLVSPIGIIAGQGMRGLNICLSAGDGSFGTFELNGTQPSVYTIGSLCKTYRGRETAAVALELPKSFATTKFSDLQFGDYNGDGRTDLLVADDRTDAQLQTDGESADSVGCGNGTGKCWNICLANSNVTTSSTSGNVISFRCSRWKSGITEAFSNVRFGDFNGDGRTDLISSNNGAGLRLELGGGASNNALPDTMTRITNGLGAYTNITYAPITGGSVYTKGTGQTGNRIDIQSPMYVVKSTSSSNGIGGTFDTTYKYESLIGQTDGRGLMGFGKRSVTHNNGEATVRTEMTYEQEWWKAGRIKMVRKYIVGVPVNGVPTDVLVNEAVNTYDWKQNVPYAKVNQVYLINTIEKSWNLNKTTGAAEALPYTLTDTPLANIDGYGNVGKVTATSYEPNGTANGYSKVTVNTFSAEDPTNWILGRLSTASVTHNMPGPTVNTTRSTVRTSSFDYYASNGQLQTERVEPDSANLDEKLTTTYTYGDPFGQRTKTSVDFYENGTLKTRSSTTAYTADGRFVASMTNAYNQAVSYTGYDRRFGGVSSSTGINGLTGKTYYDAFGRKVGEELKDSADNRLAMSIMTYSPFPNASSPTGVIVNTKNHTGSESQMQADSLGREVSSSARRFDGTSVASITAYDTFGRKAWVSGPRGGTGATSAYLTTTFEYDKLARPTVQVIRAGKNTPLGTEQTRTTTEYGVQEVGTTTYSLLTAIQSGAQYAGATATHTIVKYTDSQGRTFKITDNAAKDTTYGYDPLGNLENVTGPGAISETMTYDVRGRKKSSTNANITGKYIYVYNGAGELISQTDPKLQTTTMTYDLLGRMVSRTEAGSFTFVSTWAYDNSASGPSAGKLLSNSAAGTTTHAFIYDAQSRLTQTNSTIVGKTYNRYTLYNAQGQVSYVGYPDSANDIAPFGVRHSYNAYGYATTVARQDNPAEIYWTTTGRFDDGSLATANHGGAFYEKDYDTLGRQSAIRLKQINNTVAQSSAYSYDNIGNVLTRGQTYASLPANNYTENFCYDKLNRVTSATASSGSCSSPQFTYSDDGNLTSKGGTTGNIGTITYGTTARTNGAGPHAVASANGKTYAYDENGNFIYYKPYTDANGNRTSYVDYLPFNLPRSITGNNTNIAGLSAVSQLVYDYDADHTRISEQVYSGPNAGSNTIYVGPGFFEVANNANGSKEYRHYIGGPDGTIGIRTVAVDVNNNLLTSANGQGQTTRYWLKDHLGSPASEYDAGAVNLTPLGFDTWGLRRKNTAANTFTQSLSTADLASYQSPRGYTGHEHLDDVGLIHMNGRIYDPMIGRFMQPDPVISEPYNSQNFNRYAYVLNNPLMYTDPSGYSTWTEIRRPVAAIVVAVVTYGVGTYFAVGTFFAPVSALTTTQAATIAVASGFASGGVAGGNLESAIAGAIGGGLFFGVGELGFAAGSWQNIVAHAAAGCVNAGVQGGSCRAGAVSAGFAEFAGPRLLTGNIIADAAVHATLGGVGAAAAGGKFGNGAITGAFGYLFNSALHEKSASDPFNDFVGPRPPLQTDYSKHNGPKAFGTIQPADATEVYHRAAISVKDGVMLAPNGNGQYYLYNYDNAGPGARYHFSKILTSKEAAHLGYNSFVKAHKAANLRVQMRSGGVGGSGGMVSGAFATIGSILAERIVDHLMSDPKNQPKPDK